MLTTQSMRKPRIGLIALGRSTFDVPFAEEILSNVWGNLKNLDVDFIGVPNLLFDAESVQASIPLLQEQKLDILLLLQVTFTDAAMTVEIAKKIDTPLVIWSFPEERTGGRLRLNSFCGLNLASHALSRSEIDLEFIYEEPNSETALEKIQLLAKAGMIANCLQESKILLIGEHPDGFDACNFNEIHLKEKFGVTVDALPVLKFIDHVKSLPDNISKSAYERREKDFPNLKELDQEATCKTLKVYSAIKQMSKEKNYNGIAVRCWPDFFTDYGCAACGALALLNEDKIPCGCEADMMGVITSLSLQMASNNSVFNTDLVDIDVENNTIVFWHCGQAPIDMADRTQLIQGTIHSNRKLPLLSEFTLKPGRITLARFSQGHNKLRLILAGGEMIQEALPFSGTSGTAKLDLPAKDFLQKIITDGLEHHTSITYGDHRVVMRALAKRLGIEVIEY